MQVKIRNKWIPCVFSSFITKELVCVSFNDGSTYRTHISNVRRSENKFDFSVNSLNYQNMVLFLKYASPLDLNRLLSKLPDVRIKILKSIIAMESIIKSSIVYIKYKKSFIYAKVLSVVNKEYKVKIIGKQKIFLIQKEEILANLGVLESERFEKLNLKILKRNKYNV